MKNDREGRMEENEGWRRIKDGGEWRMKKNEEFRMNKNEEWVRMKYDGE